MREFAQPRRVRCSHLRAQLLELRVCGGHHLAPHAALAFLRVMQRISRLIQLLRRLPKHLIRTLRFCARAFQHPLQPLRIRRSGLLQRILHTLQPLHREARLPRLVEVGTVSHHIPQLLSQHHELHLLLIAHRLNRVDLAEQRRPRLLHLLVDEFLHLLRIDARCGSLLQLGNLLPLNLHLCLQDAQQLPQCLRSHVWRDRVRRHRLE
mmetsp:Transcript_63726/g.174933  ORF Transcript_63726/g.174933 Transcript_63726/m.174933 type:complete len:208 (-) Transcript_63726:1713-2336(-)